jgi:peptide/nickel transport system substrate-binding protein
MPPFQPALPRRSFASLATAAALLPRIGFAQTADAPKTLNVGTGGAFTSIDPHYHNLTPNNVISNHLFNGLMTIGPNYNPEPALALSWTPVGEHIWEFKLRPGVVFSDGTPFTADDVVFTFERVPTVVNSPSSFNQAIKPVERLEVVDPMTIRMHTKNPEPLLPNLLMSVQMISRKHGTGAVTADYNSGKAAIGTGPYVLESVLLGDKIVFKRNEKFWGPKPYWETVNYRLIANGASRTAALQAGDVDIIDQVSTRDVALLQKDPKLIIKSPAGQRLIYLYMDTEREQTPFARDNDGKLLAKNPLKELKVRQALSLAINRNGLKAQIMDGFAAPTGQLLPEGAVGYTPDLKPDPYEPAKAKALLAEAGYPQGFQITLAGPNDRYVNDKQLVEAIAQMWTRVGVKTTVDTKPASMFFAEGARDLYTISLSGWGSDTGEASSSLIQICASVNPEKGRGAQPKPSHFARADIDAVIEESLATFDPDKRLALYIKAEKMTAAEEGFIPLHHQVNIWAMKKHYSLRPRQQEGTRAYEVDYNADA